MFADSPDAPDYKSRDEFKKDRAELRRRYGAGQFGKTKAICRTTLSRQEIF